MTWLPLSERSWPLFWCEFLDHSATQLDVGEYKPTTPSEGDEAPSYGALGPYPSLGPGYRYNWDFHPLLSVLSAKCRRIQVESYKAMGGGVFNAIRISDTRFCHTMVGVEGFLVCPICGTWRHRMDRWGRRMSESYCNAKVSL